MTIKEAFQKLALSLAASIRNPFFVNKRLYNDFAEIADKIEEGGGSTHEYSTDEQIVGKWIDGETDVYEKTINLSEGFTVSSNQKVDLAVIEDIMPISIKMTILENGTWYMCPDPSLRLNYVESDGKIQGSATSSWNVSKANLIIRYLKVSA